jgi:hypothetical protein
MNTKENNIDTHAHATHAKGGKRDGMPEATVSHWVGLKRASCAYIMNVATGV